MKLQALAILAMGANAVLVKGGHSFSGQENNESSDLLASIDGEVWFDAERIDTVNTHGTGCSLSSAIAANLARGMSLAQAVASAKQWLTGQLLRLTNWPWAKDPGQSTISTIFGQNHKYLLKNLN